MPERIQLSRAKGWRKPADTIVVSRPSVLGNPFTVGATTTIHCNTAGVIHETDIEITPEIAVAAYRSYMTSRLTLYSPDDPEDVAYVQLWRDRLDKWTMKRTCLGCGAYEWSRAASRSYSAALQALRDTHRDEFDDIRTQLRADLDDEEWVDWTDRHAEHGQTAVLR